MSHAPPASVRARRPVLAVLLLAALLAVPSAANADGPDAPEYLPIVFVHGTAGSGAQYQTQALRFASNGYPADRIRAFEYDGANVLGAATGAYTAALTSFVDALRAEYGVERVNLVGHSLGTSVSNLFLSNAARAARISKYVGIDGSSNATCGAADPGLDCMGIWQGTNTTGNVGGTNVRLSPQTHVEVATSAESFAAQFAFFRGEPPATTLVLPEPPGRVQISGRAVLFPANSGPVDATLTVWELHAATGHRKDAAPTAVVPIAADGSFGPIAVNGQQRYELLVTRPGFAPHHFYFQSFSRSSELVRLNLAPPGSAIVANTNLSDAHAAAVIVRQREWWTTHPSGLNDLLWISTTSASGGDQPPANVLTATGNGSIGIHVHDGVASPGVSSLTLLPFFPTQAFQTGVDVYMPAADPVDGTVSFVNAPRGDTSRLQRIDVPNWRSSTDRITVTFNDYAQDVNTWGECKRAKPSPC